MAFKSYYKLVKYKDLNKVPFYVEDVSGQNSTLTVNTSRSDATNVEYSTDGQTWSSTNPNLSANGRVYIRANATVWENSSNWYGKINSNNNYKVGGNIMSLLYGSSFTGNETAFPTGSTQTFRTMFAQDSKLTDASALILPATTLVNICYYGMFYGCTSLIAAPELPATTLANLCYYQMFMNTPITTAPALPATTLTNSCYYGMFMGCTNLTTTPELPATTLANGCYQGMFRGCTSLTQAPALPATTLAQECYSGMFQNCTSLTTAPILPANRLNQFSYNIMFNGCTSLNSVTVGATNWNTSWAVNWVDGVSATGTFTKPSATNIAEGTSGIPSGWTVVNV